MQYRNLGASGLKVPVLSFGTGTFGGEGPLFSQLGQQRGRGGAAADRHLPRGRRQSLRQRRCLFERRGRGGARRRHQGPARQGPDLDQDEPADGRRPGRCGLVAPSPDRRRRGRAQASRDRPHRSAPAPRLRRRDADRGGALHARSARARRQAPLCRRLEFLRLAAHEVARHRRAAWLAALCRASGLLLARRPRLRVGADAARPRPGRRRARLEPARLGPPHRQDPARPAAARGQPPARDRAIRTAGRRGAALPRRRRARRGGGGDRQERAADRDRLAARAADRVVA